MKASDKNQHLEGENLMVVASHPLPFSREKTSSENSTQHFLNCPLIQVLQFKLTNDQDTTLVKFTTESNKGFHLFTMVKEEATQSVSQEHDLVDTRRKTEVKLCKN